MKIDRKSFVIALQCLGETNHFNVVVRRVAAHIGIQIGWRPIHLGQFQCKRKVTVEENVAECPWHAVVPFPSNPAFPQTYIFNKYIK